MQILTRERAPLDEGMWMGREEDSLRCQKWKRRGRVARMMHWRELSVSLIMSRIWAYSQSTNLVLEQ